MNDGQLLRYLRHILLDEIDIEGRIRLLESHALVIDADGLDTAALPYLAVAGIGTFTIVDDDTMGPTNLQRQITHTTESAGQPKVTSMQAVIAWLSPDVRIHTMQRRFDTDAIGARFDGVSVVLDCSDNFGIRQVTNLACVRAGMPLVSDTAIHFDGQISVFDSRAGSLCYACPFPPDKPASDVACVTIGASSSLVDMVGTAQAAEALKLIAGINSSLAGRLLMFDDLTMEWAMVRIVRQPSCPICEGMY